MPGGDGTGPKGMGSMTGRAAGFCAGSSVPGYMNLYGRRYPGMGRGFYRRAGRGGRGHRNWYYATGEQRWSRYNMDFPAWGGYVNDPYPYKPEEEIELLKDQADMLEQQLNEIQERMEQLKKSPSKKEK